MRYATIVTISTSMTRFGFCADLCDKIGIRHTHLKNLDFNLLDTGHFALEEDGDVIAGHIRRFLDKHLR